MKNIIFAFVFSLMLLPFAASANQLPTSTWQVYGGGVLTVYSGSNNTTSVVFQGNPIMYNGSATSFVSHGLVPMNSSINIDTRWQVYSAGTLTVHSNDNESSSIIYSGPPKDYVRVLY